MLEKIFNRYPSERVTPLPHSQPDIETERTQHFFVPQQAHAEYQPSLPFDPNHSYNIELKDKSGKLIDSEEINRLRRLSASKIYPRQIRGSD